MCRGVSPPFIRGDDVEQTFVRSLVVACYCYYEIVHDLSRSLLLSFSVLACLLLAPHHVSRSQPTHLSVYRLSIYGSDYSPSFLPSILLRRPSLFFYSRPWSRLYIDLIYFCSPSRSDSRSLTHSPSFYLSSHPFCIWKDIWLIFALRFFSSTLSLSTLSMFLAGHTPSSLLIILLHHVYHLISSLDLFLITYDYTLHACWITTSPECWTNR